MKNIAIIGSGTWGVALAMHLSNIGHNVKLWAFMQEEADNINIEKKCKFLPDVRINDNITCYTDIQKVVEGTDMILHVTPSKFVRETIKKYKNEFEQGQYYEKKEGSVRGIKILLVIVGIAALISGLAMAFSGIKSSSALFIVLGIAIFALGIFSFVAVFTKINKIIEGRKRKKEELQFFFKIKSGV